MATSRMNCALWRRATQSSIIAPTKQSSQLIHSRNHSTNNNVINSNNNRRLINTKQILNNNNLSKKGQSNKLYHLSNNTKYNSAFDPFWTLHKYNVTKEQQQAFREVWDSDSSDIKNDLTQEEMKLFQTKIDQTTQIDEFEELLKGLWGPQRHHFIRKTRTWLYTKDIVYKYIGSLSNASEGGSILVFGDNDAFDNFVDLTGLKRNDRLGLLNDFTYADLRYMCCCIAIDYFCAGKGLANEYSNDNDVRITAIFGCRKTYHYGFPDPIGRSAHWMTCIYDRCSVRDLVLLTSINAIKENKTISPNYFKEHLEGIPHNALKEEEWRRHAESFIDMDPTMFQDRFDRAFNAFQTDPGVSSLIPRYDSDINTADIKYDEIPGLFTDFYPRVS